MIPDTITITLTAGQLAGLVAVSVAAGGFLGLGIGLMATRGNAKALPPHTHSFSAPYCFATLDPYDRLAYCVFSAHHVDAHVNSRGQSWGNGASVDDMPRVAAPGNAETYDLPLLG